MADMYQGYTYGYQLSIANGVSKIKFDDQKTLLDQEFDHFVSDMFFLSLKFNDKLINLLNLILNTDGSSTSAVCQSLSNFEIAILKEVGTFEDCLQDKESSRSSIIKKQFFIKNYLVFATFLVSVFWHLFLHFEDQNVNLSYYYLVKSMTLVNELLINLPTALSCDECVFVICPSIEKFVDILYPDPGFPIYRSMIEFTGANPVPVPIREENGFAFSADETLSLITPKTRLLIINSPANPTGGVTPKEEIDKLVKGLEKFPDVAIMSDEIYDQLTFDGLEHQTLLAYPEIRDRLILLNGWSKTYAMTGWRLGWSVWPKKLYDDVRKLGVNAWSCVNAPTQWAGIAALEGPQDAVDHMRREFDKRRKLVTEGLNALPGVSCATPKGAFYAYPNIKETGWKAKPLASALLEEAGVAVIGGPDFGVLGEGYIRLSYANSAENISRALDRMGDFLAKRKAA